MTTINKTLQEIAQLVNAELKGDPSRIITGIATLNSAHSGQISFLSNPAYRKFLSATKASAVILSPTDAELCPPNVDLLISDNPYASYAKVATLFAHKKEIEPGIHPTAVLGSGCQIGKNVSIGAYCVIGKEVHIGDDSVISAGCMIDDYTQIGRNALFWPRVTIYHSVIIGESAILHSGVVIGGDGFGMAKEHGVWKKIPQLGTVNIGNNVEIGSNTTIDRGALEDTIIEDGVKLDNQIQIGHNCVIGANSAIAGCTGIAGSTRIGKNCLIGGGSCFAGHITIADNTVFLGMSGVHASITEPDIYCSALGVEKKKIWGRTLVRIRQLEEMALKIGSLEKKIYDLTCELQTESDE